MTIASMYMTISMTAYGEREEVRLSKSGLGF